MKPIEQLPLFSEFPEQKPKPPSESDYVEYVAVSSCTPHEKVKADGEDFHIAVYLKGGRVVVEFDRLVKWLGFFPMDATVLAKTLIKLSDKAKELRSQGGSSGHRI